MNDKREKCPPVPPQWGIGPDDPDPIINNGIGDVVDNTGKLAMSSDITRRLRQLAKDLGPSTDHPMSPLQRTCYGAADEIERLDVEIERLRVKLLDYDNQWSRVAKAIEGDATDSPDGTIAGRVEQEVERLKAQIEHWKHKYAKRT
jgi:archaellum component FlaC